MWVWYAQRCGIASKFADIIFDYPEFGDVEEIYNASREELAALRKYNISSELISMLADKSTLREENILNWCAKNKITIITKDDEIYPKALKALRDAPVVLYCKGKMPDLNFNLSIGVVGTRKMSEYGKNIAYEMGRGLSAGGAILVSGMALGIDGMSMSGALDVGGTTVAVLGCGIDIIYPRDHARLFERILEKGAVITEYIPGTPPAGVNFPIRNRIISGITQGVVVVEADMKSGALITAKHAIYQAREVYAVPGPIKSDNSSGTNYLIKEGVFVATCAEDILQRYTFLYPHSVNLQAARMYGISTIQQSDEGAKRNNIASSSGKTLIQSGSFYGSGLYGGKASDFEKKSEVKTKTVIQNMGSSENSIKSGESKNKKSSVLDFSKLANNMTADNSKETQMEMAKNSEFAEYIRHVPDELLESKDKKAVSSIPLSNEYNKEKVKHEKIDEFYNSGTDGIPQSRMTAANNDNQKNINIKGEPAHKDKKKTDNLSYEKLDVKSRDIYDVMPDTELVTSEWFVSRGYSMSVVMSAMTMLEIYGLVKSCPGGSFKKL